MATKRPKCTKPGCNNLARKRGKKPDGTWSYKKLCSKHERKKYGIPHPSRYSEKYRIPDNGCIVCGWHVTSCDRHRIESFADRKGYTEENVRILCPNCHRLVHYGLLVVE